MKLRAALTSLALSTLLLGCGGGGGGGSGASGGGTATARLDSPASVSATLIQNQTMPGITLTGSVGGDLTALDGKTLLIVVEDPDQLYERFPTVTRPTPTSLSVALRGRAQATVGQRRGNLRVFACLDAACATQLQGSPMSVPYDVTVRAALEVDGTTINQGAVFGQSAPSTAVRLGMPSANATFEAAVTTPTTGGARSYLSLGASSRPEPLNGSLQLVFSPAPPGVYQETVRVTVTVPATADQAQSQTTQDLQVTYTVADNPALDVYFYPQPLVINRTFIDTATVPTSLNHVLRSGVTLEFLEVAYLSAPAGASVATIPGGWLAVSPTPSTTTCYSTTAAGGVEVRYCLPAGIYQAEVRYRATKAGVTSTVAHQVTLQITAP